MGLVNLSGKTLEISLPQVTKSAEKCPMLLTL